MTFAAFDTLEFVETLKESGLPEKQAKAISVAVRKVHESSDVATKADLREYESAIRGDLEKLETGLRHEIGEVRHEIGGLRQEVRHAIELQSARFEKRLLIWGVTLASITLFGKDTLSALLRLFH